MSTASTTKDVHFSLLGPLRLSVAGRPQRLPKGKQRSLLAALLVHANQDVAVDRLTEYVWEDDPPRRPRAVLQTYVTRLRHTLAAAHPGLCTAVETTADGYRLAPPSESVDLLRFRALVAQARRHNQNQDLAAEAEVLTRALSLRSGPFLSDVRSAYIQDTVVPALTEEWLSALERRSELDVVTAAPTTELIADLRGATSTHPYRERFILLLMRALADRGRRVEALDVYASARQRFRAAFGLEPGPELRQLQVQIMRGEPPR
ncbi:winged helix-turn-helix domain-containing protein [Kineosporia rhizophila]|uniref:AfsR/SARP family transcriptional regulator n=1 Tax=Kineosporia rhizophila TaxID=84633 RepID=UPI001E4CD347|nr:winged helix-turn-helix domain-containing protein [Kineosporia rhizophila]